MRSLPSSSSSYLIRLCNDVRALTVNGVARVLDVYSIWSSGKDDTLRVFETVSLVKGLGIYRSTLPGSAQVPGISGGRPCASSWLIVVMGNAQEMKTADNDKKRVGLATQNRFNTLLWIDVSGK